MKVHLADSLENLCAGQFTLLIKPNYHINCGVIHGFSGPEKSCNNTREKVSYFFTCVDIANQLLTRHSVRLMNEHLKIRIADRQ